MLTVPLVHELPASNTRCGSSCHSSVEKFRLSLTSSGASLHVLAFAMVVVLLSTEIQFKYMNA